MIVSTYQPYFAPYPVFFEKILLSDVFVIMDSVQFPLGKSWLTRNRFKNDKGIYWVRVPVWRTGKGLQKINEVKICYERDWTGKILRSFEMSYKNAPYFSEVIKKWEKLLIHIRPERLIDINIYLIRCALNFLGINKKILLLSELGISLKEPELTLYICKELKADKFLAQKSAKKYLDKSLFEKEGIELIFFNPRPCIYPQLWGEFIPNLSVFDLIFNCGAKSLDIMKKALL